MPDRRSLSTRHFSSRRAGSPARRLGGLPRSFVLASALLSVGAGSALADNPTWTQDAAWTGSSSNGLTANTSTRRISGQPGPYSAGPTGRFNYCPSDNLAVQAFSYSYSKAHPGFLNGAYVVVGRGSAPFGQVQSHPDNTIPQNLTQSDSTPTFAPDPCAWAGVFYQGNGLGDNSVTPTWGIDLGQVTLRDEEGPGAAITKVYGAPGIARDAVEGDFRLDWTSTDNGNYPQAPWGATGAYLEGAAGADLGAVAPGAHSATVPIGGLPDGRQTLHGWRDAGGWGRAEETREVIIDRAPPVVPAASLSQEPAGGGKLTVNWEQTDLGVGIASGQVEVQNGTNWIALPDAESDLDGAQSLTVNQPQLPLGTYAWRVNVVDFLGHRTIVNGPDRIAVFRIATITADPPGRARYVALGDSYSAGLGGYNYDPLTNIAPAGFPNSNTCRRSPNAYPHLLIDRGPPGTLFLDMDLDLAACSGALVGNPLRPDALFPPGKANNPGSIYNSLLNYNEPPFNEGSQLKHLDKEKTKLVTITLGGNDLHFAKILEACLKAINQGNCAKEHTAAVLADFDVLFSPDQSLGNGSRYERFLSDVRDAAPKARIVILNYARFFPKEGKITRQITIGSKTWTFYGNCERLEIHDQLWINERIRKLDEAIQKAAGRVGVRFVDMFNASDQHELCRRNESLPAYMNGIRGIGPRGGFIDESFHPTPYGYGAAADKIRANLAGVPGIRFTVKPGKTATHKYTVKPGSREVTFTTTWPGSDVFLSMRSPGGRLISRATTAPDVIHDNGETFERYTIADPEPGEWTVELYGAEVLADGEPVDLEIFEEEPENQTPQPKVSFTQDGWTVRVDAAGSTDPDGDPMTYLWTFGSPADNGNPDIVNDTGSATGQTASFTYGEPGTYAINLMATDTNGGQGFESATTAITIKPDAVKPSVSITTPSVGATYQPDGVTYRQGERVLADFSCTDEAGGSGILTCTGTTANGAPLDTTTLGRRTLAVTATDAAGNVTIVSRAYNVVNVIDGASTEGGGNFTPGGLTSVPGDLLPGLDRTSRAQFSFGANRPNLGSPVIIGHLEFKYAKGGLDLADLTVTELAITTDSWAESAGTAKIKGKTGTYAFNMREYDGTPHGKPDRVILRVWAPALNPRTAAPTYQASGTIQGNVGIKLP